MVISLFVHGTHLVTYNRGRCLTPKKPVTGLRWSSLSISLHLSATKKAILACFVYLYNTLSYFVILTFLVCREYPYSRIIHCYVQNYKMAYFLIQIYIQYFLKINSI